MKPNDQLNDYTTVAEWKSLVEKEHGDVHYHWSSGNYIAYARRNGQQSGKQIAHFRRGPGREKWIDECQK